jgi:hypothetical protein
VNTLYPAHNPKHYSVEEHNIVDAPPDLWPLIKAWLARNSHQAKAA